MRSTTTLILASALASCLLSPVMAEETTAPVMDVQKMQSMQQKIQSMHQDHMNKMQEMQQRHMQEVDAQNMKHMQEMQAMHQQMRGQ